MASWGPFKVLLIALIFVNVNGELYLNPSENQWTRLGSNVTLFCKATEKISKCSWETAYEKMYQFGTVGIESKAESGRLQYYLSKDKKECGLTIENVKQKDVGTWSCHVTTVTDELGIVAGKGQTTVTIASRPNSVDLDQPYNQGSINVSLAKNQEDSASKPINCRVSNADPKPTFNWYIGDAMLSSDESQTKDIKDDNNTWVQTLFYTPEVSHDNKTLRCVVDHVGLEDTDKREASVTLRFTKRDKEILKETITAHQDRTTIICVVITTIVVFCACLMIMICYNKRWCCFKTIPTPNSSDEDDTDPKKEIIKPSEFTAVELTSLTAIDGESNGNATTDPEKAADEHNGTQTDVEETVRERNLSERVASFFRFTRKDSSNKSVDNVELGLNSSKCSTNGKANGTMDGVDTAEEKGDVDKTVTEGETSSHETPIRFSKFLNLFKRTGQKTMEKMDEDENEVDENADTAEKTCDKDQGENDQGKENFEFEPDTKPAEKDTSTPITPPSSPSNNLELEKEDSSPPLSSSPKNTAV